jgi:hypothetical protein
MQRQRTGPSSSVAAQGVALSRKDDLAYDKLGRIQIRRSALYLQHRGSQH